MEVHFATHLQAEEFRAVSHVLFLLYANLQEEVDFNRPPSHTLLPTPEPTTNS